MLVESPFASALSRLSLEVTGSVRSFGTKVPVAREKPDQPVEARTNHRPTKPRISNVRNQTSPALGKNGLGSRAEGIIHTLVGRVPVLVRGSKLS